MTIAIVLILISIFALAYFRPYLDYNSEGENWILWYFWRGKRKYKIL